MECAKPENIDPTNQAKLCSYISSSTSHNIKVVGARPPFRTTPSSHTWFCFYYVHDTHKHGIFPITSTTRIYTCFSTNVIALNNDIRPGKKAGSSLILCACILCNCELTGDADGPPVRPLKEDELILQRRHMW